MRIKRISLKNYRKFDKLEITFDQQMTVIAALNSSGKTIVLDAVRACLWAFVRRVDAASGSKSVGIHIDDVTLLGRDSQVEAQLPSVIAVETFDDLSWEISREKVTPKTNTRYIKAKLNDFDPDRFVVALHETVHVKRRLSLVLIES